MSLWRRILQERRRVLWPLAAALAINLAALVLGVLPLRAAVGAAEARVIDAQRQLGEARRLERQAADARARTVQADEELKTFYGRVLPRDFQAAQTTANLWLLQAAEAAGLVFKASHFDWSEVRDAAVSRASVRVTLEGPYASLRRFLRDVETAEEFLIVDRVEVADPGEAEGDAGRLQVSMVVSTYFLTTPPS